MHILISNDDGIQAKGLKTLIQIAREIADQVTVIAPSTAQSGMGHAITTNRPLRLHKITEEANFKEYACAGTPADCIKMGLKIACGKNRPDIVLSGINHGSNASSNVLYSGTMGAAIEACMDGMPSIGFSLLDFDHDADFSQGIDFIKEIILKTIKSGLPKGICLNVNIPNIRKEEIKGIEICSQADAYWVEEYIARKDPWNGDYYWLSGEFNHGEMKKGTDLYALTQDYISVVPIQYDLTAYSVIDQLKKSWN